MIDILLIEDNPGDVRLTMEVLEASKMRNNLYVAEDGIQAMQFHQQIGRLKNAPHLDIILLDLNLPRMDGRAVLRAIKKDEALRRIPIVIMATSDDECDMLAAYDLFANGYSTKPIDLQRFIEIVKSINDFWFSTVQLPKE